MSVMVAAYLLARRWIDGPDIDPGTLAALLAALSIWFALLAHDALRSTPLAWLYVRPRWARPGARPGDEGGALGLRRR